ncbi:MAG: hypothetical protein E4H01_07275 [Lysobacterales bacterium]|nr:MAG: hypothetical protein E4H01_07275 [Xanthomonadales bacterium]
MQLNRRLFDSAGEGAAGGAPASTGGVGSTGGGFTWNDGWRSQLAAGSTDSGKELKQLERYESPEQIWRKARELERKMSAGELRSAKPEGGTDAEITKWRSENNVPAKPEEYEIHMAEGGIPPKDDDPFLQSFLKSAHAADYTQSQVNSAISSFYGEVAAQQTQIAEAEAEAAKRTDDQLHQEWGADYRVNKNMAEALLARAPEGFRDRFMNGYLDDHTPIKASPEAWKWLVQMEREVNAAATVLPGAGGDVGASIATELASLRKMMGNTNSEYWKGADAEKNQARYRQLIEAEEKVAKRG